MRRCATKPTVKKQYIFGLNLASKGILKAALPSSVRRHKIEELGHYSRKRRLRGKATRGRHRIRVRVQI